MAENQNDSTDPNDLNNLEISDADAEKLLADAVDEDAKSEPPATDGKDWKAEAEKWRKLSRQNEATAKQRADALKKYEDANKSEAERLQEERDSHRSRAEKAEAALRRREIAEDRAPEHATAKQIAQVAKRMAGDDDDALASDADELFAMWAPAPAPSSAPKTPSRPQERLRGGAEPDEDPEPSSPRDLAALIPRRS